MILKGILKSYASGTHQATVQIVGSLTTWLSGIPVSHGIAAADMVAGRNVAVLTPDPAKPGDSVVIALWAAATAPSGGGGGTKIEDGDSDTSVDVEETSDDDNIVMTVGGTEAFRMMYSSGILDLAQQATAGMEYTTGLSQTLKPASVQRMILDTSLWDTQSECNVRKLLGTADATEANKLHDAGGGFAASDVGAAIWNKDDHTYTTVTGFVDSGELDLDDNIMANGEDYALYHSRYTVTKDGTYFVVAICGYIWLEDGKRVIIQIRVNGAFVANVGAVPGARIATNTIQSAAVLQLSTDDYVEAWARHDDTVNRDIKSGKLYVLKAV